MIGIIAAMNVEMESLRSFMTDTTTETISGITFVSGTLEGKQVVTAVCGIGKVFAAMCAQTMILRYQPECIVNTGVAGTLSDKPVHLFFRAEGRDRQNLRRDRL